MKQLTIENVDQSMGKRLYVCSEIPYTEHPDITFSSPQYRYTYIGKLIAFDKVMLAVTTWKSNVFYTYTIAEYPLGIYVDERGFWKRFFNIK